MPGRKFSAGNAYRYGFNGQEKSTEINGLDNFTTAEFWEYDSRLGRRWNVDPVLRIGESPYSSFSNNPIMNADPDGDDPVTGNSKGDRSLKKFEKKFNKLVNGGMSKEGAYKEMQFRYGQKKWFYIADKNLSQNGEGYDYHNVGKLFRYYQSLKEPVSTQTVGLVNNGTDAALWQSNGKQADGIAMKLSIPVELNIAIGSYPVEFTINNNAPNPFLYSIFQGDEFVSSYSDLNSGNFQNIGVFRAAANTTIKTGPITINVDEGGSITVVGIPAVDDKNYKNGNGTLGTTAPSYSGSITVPKPALKVPTAYTVVLKTPSTRANTFGNDDTNKHPERLNKRTLYDLDLQYYSRERKR